MNIPKDHPYSNTYRILLLPLKKCLYISENIKWDEWYRVNDYTVSQKFTKVNLSGIKIRKSGAHPITLLDQHFENTK